MEPSPEVEPGVRWCGLSRCSCGNDCGCKLMADPDGGLVLTGSGSVRSPFVIGMADALPYADQPLSDATVAALANKSDTTWVTSQLALKSDKTAKLVYVVAANDATAREKAAADYQCDGVGDQTEINAALLLGNVQLTSGTYLTTGPIRVPRQTAMIGAGWFRTIIKGNATWVAPVDGSTYGAVIETFNTATDRTTLRDFMVDGGMYNTTSRDLRGILIYTNLNTNSTDSKHIIRDVYVYACNRDAVTLGGTYCRENYLANVKVFNCGLVATGLTANGFNLACTDSTLNDCNAGASTAEGFLISQSNNRFIACKAWYSKLNGFNISGNRNTFVSCEAQDNTRNGFLFSNGPNTLAACTADSNSYNGSPAGAITGATYSGFSLQAYAITLHGQAMDKNEGSRGIRQKYGVEIASWALYNLVTLNVGTHLTAAALLTGVDATNLVQITGEQAGYPGDTGWVSPTTNTPASNWTITTCAARRVGQRVQLYVQATRTTSAITNSTTGDVANTTILTLTDARFIPTTIPAGAPAALSSGTAGRVAQGSITNAGVVQIGAVGGSIDVAIGEVISLGGSYLV